MVEPTLDAFVDELQAGPTYDDTAEFPPGLVGDVARYAMQTSRHPNAGLALGTALSVCGKLCDRRIAGPTGSTTVLYLMMLGPTGVGKQHYLVLPKVLLAEAGKQDLIGPGTLASVQALEALVGRQPNPHCALDEAGIMLSQMLAGGQNANASIMRVTNALWGALWDRYDGVERARDAAGNVVGPAFAFIGASTPRELYEMLSSDQIGNGFINRLLVVTASSKAAERAPMLRGDAVPLELSNGLRALAAFGGRSEPNSTEGRVRLEPILRLGWGPRAETVYDQLSSEMKLGKSDRILDLQGRVTEYAVRIATIIAAGRNSLMVKLIDIEWGRQIALRSRNEIIKGMDKYGPNLDFRQLCDAIHEALIEAKDHWLSICDIKRRFGRRSKFRSLVPDALAELQQEELIGPQSRMPTNGGRESAGYALIGVEDPRAALSIE